MVKDLTSRDPINARFMHGNEFNFLPTHKLWVATNHKPNIKGSDLGIWRRIHLIPFDVVIPEDKVDPNLPEKLKAGWPGILTWMVQGCLNWQLLGLCPPKSVRAATEGYRAEMDIVGGFLQDCCVLAEGESETVSALYERFVAWCNEVAEEPLDRRPFGARLKTHGLVGKRGTGGVRIYEGVILAN
jgi:putative DNA primase/helicase